MPRLRSFVMAIVMSSAALLAPRALAAQAPSVNVTGKWLFSVTSVAGTGTPTITFKQQGDSLTGHYSSPALGEADLKGTIKDRKITFSVTVDVQGTSIAITYTGAVEGNDALIGTVDLGGQASGTFTAKRSETTAP